MTENHMKSSTLIGKNPLETFGSLGVSSGLHCGQLSCASSL